MPATQLRKSLLLDEDAPLPPVLNKPRPDRVKSPGTLHQAALPLKAMKNWTISTLGLGLALAALPLVGGCVQESASSAPVIFTATNQVSVVEETVVTNAPTPEVAEHTLENAPGKLVSAAQPPEQDANLTAPAVEIAKLAQSGVDEGVMLAYVGNSPHTFNLGSDQIIYLNDIGVPGNVVTAMIQHDQSFKTTNAVQQAPPVFSNPPVAVTPVASPAPEAVEPQPAPVVAENIAPPQANVTYTYFNESLSPYGNWVEIDGYGRCWQPSVVVADRNWTPYCDRGHWVYSDCGWYWASDYSWGWAPFHYGRWFRHGIWGWCWAPDTVWGPSWVSWRSSPGYCGWAPLPPTACYRPGFGFSYYGNSVGVGFSFGLGVDCFTFVSADRFCDPHPRHHRLPPQNVTKIFHNTTIINPVAEDRANPRFHKGIPITRITEATHTDIRPVRIHETTGPAGNGRGHLTDRSNGSLTVYHPRLPEPPVHNNAVLVGEGVTPAAPTGNMHKSIPKQSPGLVNAPVSDRREGGSQIYKFPPGSAQTSGAFHGPALDNTRPAPIVGNSQLLQTPRQIGINPPTPNPRETPLNPRIGRGQPENPVQPRTEVTAPLVPQPNTPARNNLLLNRQQAITPRSQNTATVAPQNQWIGRNQPNTPAQVPRNQPVTVQPTAPVQGKPEPRVFSAAPQPAANDQSRSFNPAPQRSVPTISPVAPQTTVRPASAAPKAQPAQGGNRNNRDRP